MENVKKNEEKKVNENVVKETEQKKLYLVREKFTGTNGQEYWNYLVKGVIRGRSVKVDFVCPDKGGYEALDLVFDVSDKAELVVVVEEKTDFAGNKNKTTKYLARTSEDGINYDCEIKTAQKSDASILGMLLNILALENRKIKENKSDA